jgi:hypothetical protein
VVDNPNRWPIRIKVRRTKSSFPNRIHRRCRLSPPGSRERARSFPTQTPDAHQIEGIEPVELVCEGEGLYANGRGNQGGTQTADIPQHSGNSGNLEGLPSPSISTACPNDIGDQKCGTDLYVCKLCISIKIAILPRPDIRWQITYKPKLA